MRAWYVLVVAALLAVAAAAPVQAQEPAGGEAPDPGSPPAAPSEAAPARGLRLVVLELADGGVVAPAGAQLLTDLVRAEALTSGAAGWEVLTRENVRALLPPDTRLEDCVGACEVEVARAVGASLVVTGELSQLGARRGLTLRANRVDSGVVVVQLTRSFEADAALEEVVRALATELFFGLQAALSKPGRAPGPEAVGEARLTVRGASGLVTVDGVEVGSTPKTLTGLSPGERTVGVEGPCHLPQQQKVRLVAGETREIELPSVERTVTLTLRLTDHAGRPLAGIVRRGDQSLGPLPGPFPGVALCGAPLTVEGPDGRWSGALLLTQQPRVVVHAQLPAPPPKLPDPAWRSGSPWLIAAGGSLGVAALGGAIGGGLSADVGTPMLTVGVVALAVSLIGWSGLFAPEQRYRQVPKAEGEVAL